MRNALVACSSLALLLVGSSALAQPPGVTMEMINRQLPLEGAPLAVAGSYATVAEAATGSARHIIFRPQALDAFPV